MSSATNETNDVAYNVEKMLDHKPKSAKKANQATKYLVKWEDYPDTEASWEPASDMAESAKGAIDDYWEKFEPIKKKPTAMNITVVLG